MPAYQFYELTESGPAETAREMTAYNDTVAGRLALRPEFPHGCDVWQGGRFVGRYHRASTAEPAKAKEPKPRLRQPNRS